MYHYQHILKLKSNCMVDKLNLKQKQKIVKGAVSEAYTVIYYKVNEIY